MPNAKYTGAEELMAGIDLGSQLILVESRNGDSDEVTASGARYIATHELPDDAVITTDHPTYPGRNAIDVLKHYADMLDDNVPPEDYHPVPGGTE